ncbi:MAG: tyrosine-type recombinase/integrase [Stenotrophobium sp.]
MANIQKRGKYWRAQVRRKGWEPQTRSFDTRGEAEAWARLIENEIDRGVFLSRGESERTTLREALVRYSREITPTKRATTADSEIRKINRWLDDPLAARFLANIRGQDIALWRDARLAEGYGANTVRLWLAVISHLYTIARKEWGMESLINPVQAVRKPSLRDTARTRRLQGDEETRLLAAAGLYSSEMRTIIVFAIETAMRRSEIAGARWANYDRTTRTLHLPITKNGQPRHVPLSSSARSELDGLARRIDGKFFGYLPNGISQAFAEICRRAEIADLRFHDLRHEATSRFFEKGLDTMEVASITGHKTLQMLSRYTHLRAEKLADKLA